MCVCERDENTSFSQVIKIEIFFFIVPLTLFMKRCFRWRLIGYWKFKSSIIMQNDYSYDIMDLFPFDITLHFDEFTPRKHTLAYISARSSDIEWIEWGRYQCGYVEYTFSHLIFYIVQMLKCFLFAALFVHIEMERGKERDGKRQRERWREVEKKHSMNASVEIATQWIDFISMLFLIPLNMG